MKYDLTVGIPVYNGYPFIKDAVESVLNQAIDEFNILIINDDSTDETASYLKNLKSEKHNIEIIHQDKLGLGKTRNLILEKVKTEYLINLDADDYCTKDRFKKLYEFMESNPDVGARGSLIEYFCDNVENSGFPPPLSLSHEDILSKLLKIQHGIVFPSLIMRTDIAKKTGGFIFNGPGEDWDFMLKIAKYSKLANYNEVLYKMGIHAESTSSKNWKECRVRNKYAAYSYLSNNDVSFDEFQKVLNNNFFDKIIWQITTFFNLKFIKNYRKGIVNILRKNYFKTFIYLLLASLFAPNKIFRRLCVYFKK